MKNKNNYCSKCGKELAKDWNKNLCEACIGKKANKFKKVMKSVGVGASALVSLIFFLGKRGNKIGKIK